MRYVAPLLISLFLGAAPVGAATEWFPAPMEDALTGRLADRLVEVGVARDASAEERLEGSRLLLGKIAERLDQWGPDGVLERTPELAEIEFPPAEQEVMAATASYLVCSLALDPDRFDTDDQKFTVVLAEAAAVLVSAYLRHQYVVSGGTDEQLRDYLADQRMLAVLEAMEADQALRAYVWEQCGPTFVAILR